MKKVLLASLLLTVSVAQAEMNIPLDQQIGSFSIVEIDPNDPLSEARPNGRTRRPRYDDDYLWGQDPEPTKPDRVEQTGKVIGIFGDLVATGEKIYELANKGRPKITTNHAPINVVPKDPMTKEIVDPWDLEGASMPVERNFQAKLNDKKGKQAVAFNFKVVYSYGASLNGAGKYLTNVMVVPVSINAKHGWELTSTMSLTGIMNHGTKADPVVGAMINVKYTMNSMFSAYERNDTIHITGNGQLKITQK